MLPVPFNPVAEVLANASLVDRRDGWHKTSHYQARCWRMRRALPGQTGGASWPRWIRALPIAWLWVVKTACGGGAPGRAETSSAALRMNAEARDQQPEPRR